MMSSDNVLVHTRPKAPYGPRRSQPSDARATGRTSNRCDIVRATLTATEFQHRPVQPRSRPLSLVQLVINIGRFLLPHAVAA